MQFGSGSHSLDGVFLYFSGSLKKTIRIKKKKKKNLSSQKEINNISLVGENPEAKSRAAEGVRPHGSQNGEGSVRL